MDDSTLFEIDPELVAGFVDEAQESLATLDRLFIELEAEPGNIETINAIFRPIHTIKGNSAFFGLMKVKELAHEMESLLTLAKQEKLVLNRSMISVLLAGVDQLKSILASVHDGQAEVDDESVFAKLIEQVVSARETKEDNTELWDEFFNRFEEVKADFAKLDSSCVKQLDTVIEIAAQLKPGNSTPEKPSGQEKTDTPQSNSQTPKEKAKPSQEASKTMRVSEDSIDRFLSFVGELIVIGEMYDYLHNSISESDMHADFAKDLKRVNKTFDHLSEDLQKSIMEVRKVPVRTLLQKAPRMVRDIATASGKEIKVELVGEEINIDKRLVETLDGPLTHMVRNSADHGIEMPTDREAAGKTRQGTVCIAVAETEDHVTLTISDDGKGIDLEAVKAKAVTLGIMTSDQQLTQEQIIDLLFTSGVSTAQAVTEVSGRGVGMDVVKRNIDAANGKITINTQQGQGSDFIIQLPKAVSTQIIDGFLVRLGENCYVIPMDKVQEVFCPEVQDVSSVTERGHCVLRHNELLSVIRLSDVFGEYSPSNEQDNNGIMVSANIRKKKLAFCVDEALGVQKVVLKELEGLELGSQLYSGAAVMGDGRVAMVLDVDRLAGMTV